MNYPNEFTTGTLPEDYGKNLLSDAEIHQESNNEYHFGSSTGYQNDNTSVTYTDDSMSTTSAYTASTALTTNMHSSGTLPSAINSGPSGLDTAFDHLKQLILPFELCTKNNEIMLYNMKDEDLITSIVEIWASSLVHLFEYRVTNIAWYNWVLLDLARRMNQMNTRGNCHGLLFELATRLSLRLFLDNHPEHHEISDFPFYEFPLFINRNRARIIRLANKFGDGVCGLSEFIDFMSILSMTDEEFNNFYKDLQKSKWAICDRIKLVSGLFHSSHPFGPFTPISDAPFRFSLFP